MNDELASIRERLAAIEAALEIGNDRRRRFRFSLRALFWLLALAAAISLAVVEHLRSGALKDQIAQQEAQTASLRRQILAMGRMFKQTARGLLEVRDHLDANNRVFNAKVEAYDAHREELIRKGPFTDDGSATDRGEDDRPTE